ncbi:MAG: HEPN domain-containing protein [Xanthomonadales bacterium]|nr:HEPN domain-containing protein [Xanthomonadales bacterium]
MDIQIILNSFATDVFRRQADYDYIAARMNYRMRLRQQFLWSSQQALEKYLKAILLYNGKSARYYIQKDISHKKEYGHNLKVLNEEVSKLDYLNYELPEWLPSFLEYLTELGGYNRYLSKSSYNLPDAIHKLDEAVWNIRRYCQYIPDRGLGCAQKVPGMKEALINHINATYYKKKPITFKLSSGDLESILDRPHKDPARKALVWANLFYGKKNKNIVKFRPMSSSEVPPQHRSWFDDEEHKEVISEYIKP